MYSTKRSRAGVASRGDVDVAVVQSRCCQRLSVMSTPRPAAHGIVSPSPRRSAYARSCLIRPAGAQRSQRARACRRTLRSGGGTRVVQLLPTDRPSSNNFDSNPGRAVVRRMWSGRREPYAAAAAVPCVVQGQLTCARQDHCSDDKSQCITNRWIGDCKVLVSFAASIYCCAVSGKSAVSVASRNK